MREIVYYVASSIDGFISGPNGDISGFVQGGPGVSKYLSDLQLFDTVIMGRNTYEFGYKFGLLPGQRAYANMDHYIFSSSLKFENADERVHVRKPEPEFIRELKSGVGTPIYLCGGGEFAGWLLENELIDILKIKLNPLILDDGVRTFGSVRKQYHLEYLGSEFYEDGLQIITYKMQY